MTLKLTVGPVGTNHLAYGLELGTHWMRMKRPYRPCRSPFARLLACALVSLALLLNGVTAAMAAPVSMDPDCCAGMAGQHSDKAPCHESGNPCPASGSECDDQCLARCQGSTVVPSATVSLPNPSQPQSAPLVLIARAFRSAPTSPGLRPPISA